jgi:hypothetical protein
LETAESGPDERLNLAVMYLMSFNRIISAGVEWMAAQDTPNGKRTASQDAMLLQGPGSVLRTSRSKPASGWKQRRDNYFIESK